MDYSEILIEGIARIWPDVPELPGPERDGFESDVLVGIRSLRAAPANQSVERQAAVLSIFDAYPHLRTRLDDELDVLVAQGERVPTPEPPTLPGAVRRMECLELPVLYATDQSFTGSSDPERWFDGARGDGRLQFGVATISVPDDHRLGRREKPRGWRLQFQKSSSNHILVTAMRSVEAADFVKSVSTLAELGGRSEVLVFVHGYNQKFADAARWAGQMAFDLQFDGTVVLYGWPSTGSLLGYAADDSSARWTVQHFQELLGLLLGAGVARVHLLAYSMGSRMLAEALAGFEASAMTPGGARIQNVVFAAADVDAGVFAQQAARFTKYVDRTTLYVSSRDRVLGAVEPIVKAPRAGRAGDSILVLNGVDTIEVSKIPTGLKGHAYIGERATVLSDLYYLILDRRPPSSRFGLRQVRHSNGVYWILGQ